MMPPATGWVRATLRMPAVCGVDLLPAMAEALARATPLALEARRTEAGLVWSVAAPAAALPGILERVRVASGGRILPGPTAPFDGPAGAFYAPVPSVPYLPPARPSADLMAPETGAGAGLLGALSGAPPGAFRRLWLWGPHPDAAWMARMAGPAFAARIPEASAWSLGWRLGWAMALGGTLLAGLALNVLLLAPVGEGAAAALFLLAAAGLVGGGIGAAGLARLWGWRHLAREAVWEKLRTALLEASLEVGGPDPAALLPGAWGWRRARGVEVPRFPLAAHEAMGLWLPPAGFPVEQAAAPEGRAEMPVMGGAGGATEGIPVGRRADDGRPVMLPPPRLPVVVLGGTGSGKSSFLLNLVEAAVAAGPSAPGLLILDPHGPLAMEVLRRLARRARGDPEVARRLVVIDPTWDYAVPLNLFCAPDAQWAIATLLKAGREIWEGYWGPRMAGVLQAAALIVWAYNRTQPEGLRLSFRHLPFVLFNAQLRREELLRAIPPADLPQAMLLDLQMGQAVEMGRSPLGWQVEVASPIVSKVIALQHPWLRAALAAPRMADMARWCAEGRWVIAHLPAGVLGEENTTMIAAWIYNLFEWALRAAGSEAPRPTWMILDEVHRMARGLPLVQTLAEIRKYGGVPILAAQSLSVLRQEEETRALPSAMLANAGALAVFRPDPMDLDLLEDALGWADRARGERLRAELPAYHFYLRALGPDGRWLPPVLVDARGAFPTVGGGGAAEAEVAALREQVRAAHPEDYLPVEEGIRHEQVNAMRLLTPDVRAALEQLDLAAPEPAAGDGGRPSSLREQLGL